MQNVKEVCSVKAHDNLKKLQEQEPESLRCWQAKGNDLADRHAKLARIEVESKVGIDWSAFQLELSCAHRANIMIARAMAAFPASKKDLKDLQEQQLEVQPIDPPSQEQGPLRGGLAPLLGPVSEGGVEGALEGPHPAPLEEAHDWRWMGKTWVCGKCCRATFTQRGKASSSVCGAPQVEVCPTC